jgi:hypothetical protein
MQETKWNLQVFSTSVKERVEHYNTLSGRG